tara:strand:+ start:2870 stop:3304 length:435 start_codon:yes stop_codon:yes gene_type:complete
MTLELFFSWILKLHSYWAFLALTCTIIVIINCSYSLIYRKPFQTFDLRISLFALVFNHIQLVIGFILYFISPKFLWWNAGFKSVIENSDYRVYLIEHPIVNVIGVLIITIGWSIHKKSNINSKKFIRIGVFYLIGLFLLSSRIP